MIRRVIFTKAIRRFSNQTSKNPSNHPPKKSFLHSITSVLQSMEHLPAISTVASIVGIVGGTWYVTVNYARVTQKLIDTKDKLMSSAQDHCASVKAFASEKYSSLLSTAKEKSSAAATTAIGTATELENKTLEKTKQVASAMAQHVEHVIHPEDEEARKSSFLERVRKEAAESKTWQSLKGLIEKDK